MLYPPIWGLIRVAAQPDEIGGKEIKVGDRVVLFCYGAHHNPKFWDEPDAFRLERWMDKAKKQVKYSYVPFGGGKRSCIGGAMSRGREHARALRAAAPLPAGVRRQRAARHQRHRDPDAEGRADVRVHELSRAATDVLSAQGGGA